MKNSTQALIYMAINQGGECLQDLAKCGKICYSWYLGHLPGAALVGMSVAGGLILAQKNRFAQYAAVAIPPILATLDEVKVIHLAPDAPTYDPQDIACYWGAALLAWGIAQTSKSTFIKK